MQLQMRYIQYINIVDEDIKSLDCIDDSVKYLS